MKRALTIATLACSVLFVTAISTSEARPPVWKQARRNIRQFERDYRRGARRLNRHYRNYRNDFNRYNRRYNNHHRRYNNYYRGRSSRYYTPGFGFYYGW